jgi:hypothetical protein
MAGRALDAEELEAAELVATALHGTFRPLDVEGAPGMTPDFQVQLGERRIALEVTSTRGKAVLSVLATAFGKEWEGPGLVNDWHVTLPQPSGGKSIRVPSVMRAIAPFLAVLEAKNVTGTLHVSRWPPEALSKDADRELVQTIIKIAELDVLSVRPIGPRRGSSAHLFASIRGGFSPNIDRVNELVTAAADANLKKLLSAEATERHLFVWIHPSAVEAEFAVFQGQPPSVAATLPSGIDVVWIATHGFIEIGKVGVTQFWRLRAGCEWERLTPRGHDASSTS